MSESARRTAVADELAALAAEHLDLDRQSLVPEASLADLGIDSFQLIELVFAVEERFGVRVELDKVRIGTYQDVIDLVCGLIGEGSGPPASDPVG
jgi:acyl carrier protein